MIIILILLLQYWILYVDIFSYSRRNTKDDNSRIIRSYIDLILYIIPGGLLIYVLRVIYKNSKINFNDFKEYVKRTQKGN